MGRVYPDQRFFQTEEGNNMGLVVVLLLLALLFGGFGLFVEGLKWLLIIALVMFVASMFTGYRGRGVPR
jgi:CHASE2 domain-containing sensor protein